ncbi:hypothetical protein [Chondromyces apiculatus]|uniref:hypothetical protein n=1 Tax=Chondromyces apiculatus TaxID=51 RepID=UPI0005C78DED|nr:hypothetical protein [Chondromyces apiculatus]
MGWQAAVLGTQNRFDEAMAAVSRAIDLAPESVWPESLMDLRARILQRQAAAAAKPSPSP